MRVFCQPFLLIPVILFTCAMPQIALSFDMTQRDLTQTLYSNQLVFDRNGEPLVSVRISEGQSTVALRTNDGVTVMHNGSSNERVEFKRASNWSIEVVNSTPAKVVIWLQIASVDAGDFSEIKRLKQHATQQGVSVKRFEVGSVIGLAGMTLDTRQVILATGPYNSVAAAREAANGLKPKFEQDISVFTELLKPAAGQIVAKELKSGISITTQDALWMYGEKDTPIYFDSLESGQGTPRIETSARSYNGQIYFAIGQDGKLAVVNVLSAERLLEGVVPSELYTSAPLPALKAQAVAARGQLLAKIGTRHLADPYLLCAETHCQVYTGRSKLHPRTSKAVRETRGQLLFDSEGLVDTTYSSTCGGHSEASHLIWGGRPKQAHPGFLDQPNGPINVLKDDELRLFIQSRPEAFCRASGERAKTFRWKKKVLGAKIAKNVARFKDVGPITSISVVRRGRSGRALSIEYVGTLGTVIIDGEYTNRKVLGNLKSGIWILSSKPENSAQPPNHWVFEGAGFGHGVGLCQHGAMGMAKQGHQWDSILFHYYRNSELQKAW